MRKRREVTEIMSDHEFNEREELIENIQQLGNNIVDTLGERQYLLNSIGEMREVHSEEEYEQRRFLRRPVILTRPKKEDLTLIQMLARPYIWLSMDKRFVQGGRQSHFYALDLSSLHVTTLRALHGCLRTYHDDLFKR